MASGWSSIPALSRTRIAGEPYTVSSTELPDDVANKFVDIRSPSRMTISDFAALLNSVGVPAIPADEEVAKKRIFVPIYQGPLGNLIKSIEVSGAAFEWHSGIITITSGYRYVARLPQDEALIKSVTGELGSMGAKDVTASQNSGIVSFSLPPLKAEGMNTYLNRTISNSAMIGLQVAVVTVSMDRKTNTGIDWPRLQAVVGMNPLSFFPPDDSNGGAGGNGNGGTGGNGSGGTGNGNTGGTGSNGATVPAFSGSAAGISAQSLAFKVSRGDFNLQMFVNMLSQYGKTKTTQNLILRTLSGSPVKIRSGESVPYVSGVGVSTLGGNGLGGSNGLLGSANVEKAESGLTLEIKPSYDASSHLVTMDMKLDLSSILGFVNLSAGAQLGTLTQPNIQEQSFNNVARLITGETVVLGGLVYDYYSDNRNTLAGLEKMPLGGKDANTKKSALIVVIRPTVTAYEYSTR